MPEHVNFSLQSEPVNLSPTIKKPKKLKIIVMLVVIALVLIGTFVYGAVLLNVLNLPSHPFKNGGYSKAGRVVDLVSTGNKLFILSEGGIECRFLCLQKESTYIKPTLFEIDTSKKEVIPHVITEKFENVSNYGNSCDRLVDLGESLFLHCPRSYLFSKSTKEFREVNERIGYNTSYYSSNSSPSVLAVLNNKNVSFYNDNLKLLKSLDTNFDFKAIAYINEGILLFHSNGVALYGNDFKHKQGAYAAVGSRSSNVFLDSVDPNIIYYYSSGSDFFENQVYKFNLKTNVRHGPIAFSESRQDRDTVFNYRVGSFAQTSQYIYFLLKTYISEPGVGKAGPVELVIADKNNLDIIKSVKLEIGKKDSLSEEGLSTNVNMLAINNNQLFILVNDRNRSGKILIYDLDGNLIQEVELSDSIMLY